MKVVEIIKDCAEILDVKLTEATLDDMVHCFNVVENEIAIEYCPLILTETFQTKDGNVNYSDFKQKVLRIIQIHDDDGNNVAYTLSPSYVKADQNKFNVQYAYCPGEKRLIDSSDLGEDMRLPLKYGVCCEYCLTQGDFEEAKVWYEKQLRKLKELQEKRER